MVGCHRAAPPYRPVHTLRYAQTLPDTLPHRHAHAKHLHLAQLQTWAVAGLRREGRVTWEPSINRLRTSGQAKQQRTAPHLDRQVPPDLLPAVAAVVDGAAQRTAVLRHGRSQQRLA